MAELSTQRLLNENGLSNHISDQQIKLRENQNITDWDFRVS